MKPFAELSAQEWAVQLLRWLLVPVAAVVAVYVLLLISRVALPPAMARLPGTLPPPMSDFQRFAPRIFGVLMAALFVLAGAKMAPHFRLVTPLVLAGLWIGYSFLIHVFVHLGRGTPHWLHFAIATGGALSAVALIGYAERGSSRGA